MKVSLNWLKDYVPVLLTPEALADGLTMSGLEVESLEDRYQFLRDVVVGRVLHVSPHPHSDHLNVCRVDIGGTAATIVCGAPNVQVDRLYPVARVGAVLPNGTIIAENQIRGIVSSGMLCSETELGLGPDPSGLMELTGAFTPGEPLASALSLFDPVLELGLTPNRSDCLSFIGVAREIAALQHNAVTLPEIRLPDGIADIHGLTSVVIDAPDLCPRYAAGLVFDITVGPSPFWLQDRLNAIGLKPVNNVVDITNYVMMETGQPLHAFDYDRLAGNRIVVRTATDNEPFTTLDHKDRELPRDTLLICDAEKPVAVAGVMGGFNSEIETATRRVLIESAWFNPISIRKTAKFLGLNTDASHRFERGINPEGVIFALKRTMSLMASVCGGTPVGGIIDACPRPHAPVSLTLSAAETNLLLGTQIASEKMGPILSKIGFETEKLDDDRWKVIPPAWRVDVSRPVDLMEEIARLSGYDAIPTTFPMLTSGLTAVLPFQRIRETIREMMVGFGFIESINYSFIPADSCDRLRLGDNDIRRRTVRVINPLSEDQSVMRTTLVPGLLMTLQRNLSQQQKNLKLFELGNTFIATESEQLPEEREMLAGLWTGNRQESSWHVGDTACDFYDQKGVLEGLFSALSIHARFSRVKATEFPYIRPGYGAEIWIGDEVVGVVGELNPLVLEPFDLKQGAVIFELALAPIVKAIPCTRKSVSLPRYPSVSRDATFIIPKSRESGSILDSIGRIDHPLIEQIQIFDVFEGGSLPQDHKSVSFRITYRSPEETLEDDRVTRIHKEICDQVIEQVGARLPQKDEG
jgi:phenylalanyl-tRNA synthetase beta chain